MLVILLCDKSNGLQEIIDILPPLLALLSISGQTILDFDTKIKMNSSSVLQSQTTSRKLLNFKPGHKKLVMRLP